MTETSLLPKAARFDGIPFEDLVEEILDDAGLDK
jgi:D-alanine-D-alanine ligase-like ATP-grasp enzyme